MSLDQVRKEKVQKGESGLDNAKPKSKLCCREECDVERCRLYQNHYEDVPVLRVQDPKAGNKNAWSPYEG